MSLEDQLKKLFPDHQPSTEKEETPEISEHELFVQKEPMICKYEKRMKRKVHIY